MGDFCVSLRAVCGGHFGFGKGGLERSQFKPCDGGANGSCSRYVVGNRFLAET